MKVDSLDPRRAGNDRFVHCREMAQSLLPPKFVVELAQSNLLKPVVSKSGVSQAPRFLKGNQAGRRGDVLGLVVARAAAQKGTYGGAVAGFEGDSIALMGDLKFRIG